MISASIILGLSIVFASLIVAAGLHSLATAIRAPIRTEEVAGFHNMDIRKN